MLRCKDRWPHSTISQSLNGILKEKFKLNQTNTNKIKSRGWGGVGGESRYLFQSDYTMASLSICINLSSLRCHLRSPNLCSLTCVSTEPSVSNTFAQSSVGSLVLYARSQKPAVASLIIFLMCGHSGFTSLFLAQSRAH